eukprot:TRINITY_DN19764_c0_g1_i1.p1 TRINITY_DN19764_c0_g1~~TRINITY_DN19764_c0_g1_i1.p1  ORF type:complete len:570 (+),score=84.80 TRINITY_DN19764_c0_g1_i1:40-1749(+)
MSPEERSAVSTPAPEHIGISSEDPESPSYSLAGRILEKPERNSARRVWWILAASCCCCLIVTGIVVGVLFAVLQPQMIEEYGICHINVCGHEPGGVPLERYVEMEFTRLRVMDETCSQQLVDQSKTEGDITLFVMAWFYNPNSVEVDVKSLEIAFTRLPGSSSRNATEGSIFTCFAGGFRMVAQGEIFVQLRCAIPPSSRENVAQAIRDFILCQEVAIRQDAKATFSTPLWSPGISIKYGDITTVNKGSTCNDEDISQWLGGSQTNEQCLGTTDVGMNMPSLWFCRIGILSARQLEVSFELDVYNPATFDVDLDDWNFEIFGGSDLTSAIGNVKKASDDQSLHLGAKTTIRILLKGAVVSATDFASLAFWQTVRISGRVSLTVLSWLTLKDIVIPSVNVSVSSDDAQDEGGRTWTEAILDAASTAQQGAISLAGYMRGNCICVYNCNSTETPPGTCPTATGGTCVLTSCDASRNAACWERQCVCKDNECAVRGVCIPKTASATTGSPAASSTVVDVSTTTSCNRDTGGTCSVMSCDASRNAVCQDGRCICDGGLCSDDGACVVNSGDFR